MKNIAKNFFYQSIFQVIKIIMPIITIPVVSSALGPSGIGIYNYTSSIVQYFILVAGLGVTMYGNREIALTWNGRKEDVSKTFWEIVVFKMLATFLVLFVYLLIILSFDSKIYFLCQTLTIISVMFDISWFFMGIQNFKKISLSNLFVQFLTFMAILLFIKNENDTLKYILIQSGGMLLSQIIVWFFVFKHIRFVRVKLSDCFKHLKGSIEYFIPQIAISLYTNLNKTLLGIFIGNVAVGYYSNSLQLNSVFITIITTFDLVLLPHMTGLFAKDNTSEIVQTMNKTVHLQLYFSIPIMFGLLTVFDKLVPWFFGEEFLFINTVIPFFSILIVVVPLGMAMTRQYLTPVGKTKEYNKSVILGAVINILLSLALLPSLGFFGAVFSNIIAELFVAISRSRSVIKSTNFKFDLKKIATYIFAAGIMCIVTRFISRNMTASLITNLIQIIIAIPIYLSITIILKTSPLRELINFIIK